jgi:hypothetical protein
MRRVPISVLLLTLAVPAYGQYGTDSPNNPDNSVFNPKSSPLNLISERIIRDSNGDAVGDRVPKADGGANYYDFNANRIGCEPAKSKR